MVNFSDLKIIKFSVIIKINGGIIMLQETFDFYDRTNLKAYNLNKTMRYQLNMLDTLDVYTRKHC